MDTTHTFCNIRKDVQSAVQAAAALAIVAAVNTGIPLDCAAELERIATSTAPVQLPAFEGVK